jgi:pimeloyl-ACP methyl ester carboxylesterase
MVFFLSTPHPKRRQTRHQRITNEGLPANRERTEVSSISKKSSVGAYLAALVFGAAAVAVTASPAFAADGPSCQQVTVPVTLSPTDPTPYNVAGWLCVNGSPAGKTVQVLVHGFTYDHRYWDWPESPQTYSYVRSATDAGYVTFAYDRIGAGASDHPADGNTVTVGAAGFVQHQIVQGLRSGSIGGTAFGRVVAVGHSFGSSVVVDEAALFHDVDGVILTGYAHQLAPNGYAAVANAFYPAPMDPLFANAGLNNTYLTTVPGIRAQLFFDTANTDASVISLDEAIKQTVTMGEFGGFSDPNAYATDQITVPVLLAVGQHDYLGCQPDAGLSCDNAAAFLAREGQYYTPQSRLDAFVLPNAGHDINLQNNAHQWFDFANSWTDNRRG